MKMKKCLLVICILFCLSSCKSTSEYSDLPISELSESEAISATTNYIKEFESDYMQDTQLDDISLTDDASDITEAYTECICTDDNDETETSLCIAEEEKTTKAYQGSNLNFTRENINDYKNKIAYGHSFMDITYVAADYLLHCDELINIYGDDYIVYFSHGTSNNDQKYFLKGGEGWVHFVIDENGTEDHYTVNCKKEYLKPWEALNYKLVENCPCQGD